MVRRIFVEKRSGFDVEAGHILSDLRTNLGLTGLQKVRVINRYDVDGLADEWFAQARATIFSEPNVDYVYDELTLNEGERAFAMEYLPGQYDQRADSAAQCVQLLTCSEPPEVLSAKVIVLAGDVSDEEFNKVKKYMINPVESREASFDLPETLEQDIPTPADIESVKGFIGWDDEGVKKYHTEMGFAMSLADLKFCQEYFRDTEGRDPFVTELRVIDTYWSDHCRHTTFLTRLDTIVVEKGGLSAAIETALQNYMNVRAELYVNKQKNVCLMDMATISTKLLKSKGMLGDLDESDEINACSIEIPVEIDGKEETWLLQFKNETHNHPTEIEPFGGAATCLGGAIRDPLSGRAYIYQAMRITGSGDPTQPVEKTLEGKLSQRKITTGAAAGYSSYGNQIGLATGQVKELYDDGYVAKRMEIGAVIGASPKENVKRLVPQAGDMVILLGGRTGRDGCGGATGSSKAHDSCSIETCGAEVQKGNPPTERKIQRLFRNKSVASMIKRCNDFGAGGVSVAIGELTDGLQIDLDAVMKKYDGLDGTELAVSESQERMAVVVDAQDAPAFIRAAGQENLEANIVAVVTEEKRLRMNWRGKTIVNLSREFLNTNGVTQTSNAIVTAPSAQDCYLTAIPAEVKGKSGLSAVKANLARLNVCSQKGLVERFDSTIGAGTVHLPFAGKYQLTEEQAMTAKIPVLTGETDDASAMSYGFIPAMGKWSPFHGAIYATVEAVSKLAAVGANPFKSRLTLQEYFEKLLDKKERWGKPVAALLGALTAQLELQIPAIGGKDSMSGSFNEMNVPPTLVCFAVSMTKASKVLSASFKGNGSKVYMLPVPIDEETLVPDWEKYRTLLKTVYEFVYGGKIAAASVVREGGSAYSVCSMAFGDKKGFKFENGLDEKTLYAPLAGSFVVELNDDTELPEEIEKILLGTVNDSGIFELENESDSVDNLIKIWKNTLENVFPTTADDFKVTMTPEVKDYTFRSGTASSLKIAQPRVFIPVFPGTNCEYDTTRAFEQAGAKVKTLIVKNLSAAAIEETIREISSSIAESQIVMFPGGFSGGDEPDGSGKFIATTFRNPYISEQVSELLKNRDGLMLGICNGFQALIKLGLVPYGEIVDISETSPTLTFNSIGRHISCMTYTRVASVKSPWLMNANVGDIHTVAVSHGEGRFVATKEDMEKLIANGQIATQYVDINGNPSADIAFNPNGSICAVEGITSPDGRVLGKMGHSERKGKNLYKNVGGEKEQGIFFSGVKYFK